VVVTLQGYRKMAFVMVLVALALAQLRYAGRPWAFWDWLCVAVLLFPPAFALLFALFSAPFRARYRQMTASRISPRDDPVVSSSTTCEVSGTAHLETGRYDGVRVPSS
jgi:hypothetical protein